MRTNTTCWALAVSTLVALSGCSNGSGSSWAFWRTSPFSSTQGATPSGVGSPEKPSGIAAGSNATPPSGTYSATNPPASPPFGQPGAQGNYNASNTGYNRAEHLPEHTISVHRRRRRPGNAVRLRRLQRNSLHGKHRRRAGCRRLWNSTGKLGWRTRI